MSTAISKLIPRIASFKDAGKDGRDERPTIVSELVDSIEVDHGTHWWKNDDFTRTQRYWTVQWLGYTLLKIPYTESIIGNYFIPAQDTLDLLSEMQNNGTIPQITADSHVFEPGSNIGRNLYWIQEKYGCEVTGMDISAEAIRLAQKKIWLGRKRYHFFHEDVLNTNYFKTIPDKYFDLCLTRWHLIHVPLSPQKRAYLAQLKRVAKTLLILEPVREGVSGVHVYHQGNYCLSWDDWATEYGLKEYIMKNPLLFNDGTRAFYNISV